MAVAWAKFGSLFDQGAFHPSCLGFAAVVATLPVYEPALHSFHTIAPETFDQGVAPYTLAAFAAMLACALAVLSLGALERRGGQSRAAGAMPGADGPGAPRPHQVGFKIAMAACCLLGALGLCLLARLAIPVALAAALGTCAGVGSALLLMAWGEIFRACTKKAALVHLAITSVLGAFLLNMVGTLPYPFAAALFGILEAVALAVPILELGREHAGEPSTTTMGVVPSMDASPTSVLVADAAAPEEASGKPAPLALHLAEPLLGIALFAMSFQVLGAHTVYLFYLSFLLGSLVAGAAVLPVLFLDGKRPLMALLYEIVLPLAGFTVVAATIAVPDVLQAITTRNGFMVFYSFAILLFLSSTIAFANAGEYDPQRVFATAIASFAGASLAGMAIGTVAPESVCNDTFCVLTFIYLAFLALRPNIEAWRHPQRSPACAVEKSGAPGFSGRTETVGRANGLALSGAGNPVDGTWPRAANTGLDDATLARLARRWGLTGRELEVLPLLVEGRTSTYIARTLYISDSTARGHAHKIYQKAGVSTREGLLAVLAVDLESGDAGDDGERGTERTGTPALRRSPSE